MFHIFALVFTLINGPVGPAGTHFITTQYGAGEYSTEESCQKAIASPAFTPQKQTLIEFLRVNIKPEYKNNFQVQYVCSDKSIEDLKPKKE